MATRIIEPLARFGLAARGALYIVVGVLAVRVAGGMGGRTTGARGAVGEVGRFYAGDFLLLVLALGLASYAAWRAVQAYADLDQVGRGPGGLATRLGYLISGLVHFGWALAAAGFAIAWGEGPRAWVARALAEPGGVFAVAIAGAIVIGVGVQQFYLVWSMRFEKHLQMGQMSPRMKSWAGRIGRFGYFARGVTFLVIGWFLIRAAMNVSAREVKDMGEALRVLGAQRYGSWVLGLVACGTIAYGLMTFIEARYRRILR